MTAGLGVISVDLDPLDVYLHKRGLVRGPRTDPSSVYTDGLPRLLEVLAAYGLPATLFAVGREALDRGAASMLRAASHAGHEVANHTFSHPDDLCGLDQDALLEEIIHAEDVLADACGARPVGFRAPGWNIDRRVFEILEARGYAYDSSLVPLPALWAMPVVARLLGHPGVPMFAGQRSWPRPPATIYPVDLTRPWRRGRARIREVPCGASVWPPCPLNATAVWRLGEPCLNLVSAAARYSSAPLVFIFHGLDFVDSRLVEDTALTKPGLRDPLSMKLGRIRRLFDVLTAHRRWRTIRDIVQPTARRPRAGGDLRA